MILYQITPLLPKGKNKRKNKSYTNQWRIQDFPRGGGANSPSGCANLFFLAENCMKMKEFWLPGGGASLAPPLDPPLQIHKVQFRYIRRFVTCERFDVEHV